MEEYYSWLSRIGKGMRIESITQSCKAENYGRPNRAIYPGGKLKAVDKEYIHDVPTWALIEELKKRPGVTFRANTTKDGLVGTFEHAPAMVFTVKLPIEEGE